MVRKSNWRLAHQFGKLMVDDFGDSFLSQSKLDHYPLPLIPPNGSGLRKVILPFSFVR
jgi:hypothetical protein